METAGNNKTWTTAILSICWRADQHVEDHSVEFERPTAENPTPPYPVVVGQKLSGKRLPQSSSWRHLFNAVEVKAFDEHSLTVQYGQREFTVKPDERMTKLGEAGMNYTTFEYYLGVKYVEPESAALQVTGDERFLRRFRIRRRILKLTDEDVALLRKEADTGSPFAQYGLARWLYDTPPTDTSMSEAEDLLCKSMEVVPDALAAYALMLRYGETKENRMDLEESNRLMQKALKRGSVMAEQQMARFRIYGQHCQAEPEIVAHEIEQRLKSDDSAVSVDCDPYWFTLLAYAYEELDRRDDAIRLYEQAIEHGEVYNYIYLAILYKQRGNMALYDSLMEEGISKGCISCYIHVADMEQKDFLKLDKYHQRLTRERIESALEHGLEMNNGLCAYMLWYLYYNGLLGFDGYAPEKWAEYLKLGVRLDEAACIEMMAELAEEGEWPEDISKQEIGELWLKLVRHDPSDKSALSRLKRQSDPAFLLQHKEEIERYWQPLFPLSVKEDPNFGSSSSKPKKTPINPMLIIIWPTGHMDIETVDVNKIPSYRKMAQQLIGGEGLDAVRNTSLLQAIAEVAELDHPLVMYVDRDAQMKNLPDNAIGTLLYGGSEVRGPIIICQQDQRGDCLSFTTQEDLVSTYNEIDKHSGGLLVVKDEDDGRWDAYV